MAKPATVSWRIDGNDTVVTADGSKIICASGDWGGIISDNDLKLIASAPDMAMELRLLRRVAKAANKLLTLVEEVNAFPQILAKHNGLSPTGGKWVTEYRRAVAALEKWRKQ